MALLDSGKAIYTDGDSIPVPGVEDKTYLDVDGIQVRLRHPDSPDGAPIVLSTGGAESFLTVRLPAGMGWTQDTSSGIAESWMHVGSAKLDSDLRPYQNLSWDPPDGDLWVMEETRPVWIRVTGIEWNTTTNRFTLEGPDGSVEYFRKDELSNLNNGTSGGHSGWRNDPPPWKELCKPSNEAVFASVSSVMTTDLDLNLLSTHVDGSDGSARLNAMFSFSESGSFYTHFPLRTRVARGPNVQAGSAGGYLKIENGTINFAESYLLLPSEVVVPYCTTCPEQSECLEVPEADKTEYLALVPDIEARAYFTEDAGLWMEGEIQELAADTWSHDYWTGKGTTRSLTWGLRPNYDDFRLRYAQQTSEFTYGSFFMPGSSGEIEADELDDSNPSTELPMYLLLSASANPSQTATPIRPTSDGHKAGAGDYAGINLWVSDQPDDAALGAKIGGISCLGNTSSAGTGQDPVWFPVMDYCHYYARQVGVTGMHAARSFPATLSVYGYAFTFDSFGLSFLDNDNEGADSVTDGSVYLPYPADFSQEFAGLMVNCLGDLGPAEVPDDAGDKALDYWQTKITPLTFEFQNEATPCTTGTGFLCLGVKVADTALPEPFYGTLAFLPSGELISGAMSAVDPDIPDTLNSRLTAPNSLYFRGALKPDGTYEEFYLNPGSEAYFNDYAEAQGDAAAENSGFFCLAAFLNIPFFEDVPVFLQTRGTDPATASLYVTSGWSEGRGTSHFDDIGFDASHVGFPKGTVSLSKFRGGGDDHEYLPRAHTDWLDAVEFDFPVSWHPTLRYFETLGEEATNVIVLNTGAEIKYLSAGEVELSFGAEFDGIPSANLSQLAYGQVIDEATGEMNGVFHSVVNAAGQEVADALNNGMNGGLTLTTDKLEDLLIEALDEQIEVLTQDLYADISAEWDAEAEAWADVDGLRGSLDGFKEDLKARIRFSLFGEISTEGQPLPGFSGQTLLKKIDAELAAIQNGLSAITGVITDPDGTVEIDPTRQEYAVGIHETNEFGLLTAIRDSEGNLGYQVIPILIYSIIEDGTPELADALKIALDGPLESLSGKLNAALAESSVSLERIRSELIRLESMIIDLRYALGEADWSELEPGYIPEFRAQFSAIHEETLDGGALDLEPVTVKILDDVHEYLELQVSTSEHQRADFPGLDRADVEQAIRGIIKDRVFETDLGNEILTAVRQRVFDLQAMINSASDTFFAELNNGIKALAAEALPDLDAQLNEFLGPMGDVIKGGGIEGYAHINGDSLRKLRLDLDLEMGLPKKMDLHGFLEINQMDSDSEGGACLDPGEVATEIIVGAIDVPTRWMDSSFTSDLSMKAVLNGGSLSGFGGAFEMSSGTIDFETLTITDFGAAVAFGVDEAYIAARAGMVIQEDYRAAGGIFFGKTCGLEPIYLVDPDVAEVLGDPPFTGAYVYGEAGMPIYGTSCAFKIEALVGAGVFFFMEGPRYGGKLVAGVSGTALCAVHVGGELRLVGLKDPDGYVFSGKGKVAGCVGSCPFCLKFSKSVKAVNRFNDWSISY